MKMEEKDLRPAQLRSFGLILGGMFAVIALWPVLLGGEDLRLWALMVSGILGLSALVLPGMLRPIYKVWMRLGSALGWLNTRLLLGIGFYGIFTPMGMVMRLFKRNPLRLGFDPQATTYRVPRSERPGHHMRRQF